ncbi:MAG: signal peptidase I [Bacillota bacterium]
MRKRGRSLFRELLEIVVIALILTFVIQTWVVETFVVEGDSMLDSLHDGDRVLVNKFIYNFSEPRRGEVVIFAHPGENSRDLIKRVVGTPGEIVEIRSGEVLVNGEPIEEDYPNRPDSSDFPPTKVPPRTIFVLGDNRGNSDDSRSFGFVPYSEIRGRTWLIFWPPSSFAIVGSTL